FLAFALDAVAIAAQAITGRYLGAADAAGTRSVTRRMERWGWVSGVVTGLLLAAVSPVAGALFTSDPDVRRLLVPVLLVAALARRRTPAARRPRGRPCRGGRGRSRWPPRSRRSPWGW